MIEAHDLTKYFGASPAVSGLSFRAEKGHVVGLLGPNGAGKTTTMRMIAGFFAPTLGTIRLCGHDMAENPRQAQRQLGYLPEGSPLYPEMTPLSFLRFLADLRGFSKKAAGKQVERTLEMAGLKEVRRQSLGTLSKGYRRRVGLAQAILHDPPVLVLDEPTDGLDPNQKQRIRSLIRNMAETKTILISTHILEEVSESCTRILVMGKGRIVADGTPSALLAQSAYHKAVSVRLPWEDKDRALSLLGKMAEVQKQECIKRGEEALMTFFPHAHVEALELANAVQNKAAESDLPLLSLQIEEGRLDDLFRHLTEHDSSQQDPSPLKGAS